MSLAGSLVLVCAIYSSYGIWHQLLMGFSVVLRLKPSAWGSGKAVARGGSGCAA